MFSILPFVISIVALGIAYYAWITNSEPYIVFLWSNERDCYYIKNVGKGPAINVIVTYYNDKEDYKEDLKSKVWKNPVKCYSLEPNGTIDIDWGVKNKNLLGGGQLIIKGKDKEEPSSYVNGVTGLAAVYSSANFLIKRTYTTIFEDETDSIKEGNKIRNWTSEELFRIWHLKRKSEKNS